MRGGVEILVATPGRLLDHIEQKSVNLGQVEIFVLDEADRMLDMGFIPDIKRIMALLPHAKRQNLLFSATFSNEIKKLADQLLNAPQLIEVARRNTAAETVSQSAYKLPQDAKRALLVHLVHSRDLYGRCSASCAPSTARRASRGSSRRTASRRRRSTATRRRRRAWKRSPQFKEGKLQVLVATDVAARGLDIDDLPLVVNYELPHVPEDYIHRIGRTGRAGATGEAISFVAPEEEKYLAEIERLLKKKVDDCRSGRIRRYRRVRSARRAARRSERPVASGHPKATHVATRGASTEHRRERTLNGSSGRDSASSEPRERATSGTTRREHASTGDTRRAEREAAYAKNPDQPLVKRAQPASGRERAAPTRAHRTPRAGRGPCRRCCRSAARPSRRRSSRFLTTANMRACPSRAPLS